MIAEEAEPVEMEVVSAPLPATVASKWKALVKSQRTTIGCRLLKLIDKDFAEAGETSPPELAIELARLSPKGRRPHKRHVPDRKQD